MYMYYSSVLQVGSINFLFQRRRQFHPTLFIHNQQQDMEEPEPIDQ